MFAEIVFIKKTVVKTDEKTFLKNEILQRALVMALLNIGELANSLSDKLREKSQDIMWFKIIGLRNIAAHDYGILDMKRIWQTVKADIPELEKQLKKVG